MIEMVELAPDEKWLNSHVAIILPRIAKQKVLLPFKVMALHR